MRHGQRLPTLADPERKARGGARARKAAALAGRLRLLRTLRGYTQDALAGRSGVPRQLISLLERARRPRPAATTIERLALALGVSTEQLRGKVAIPELDVGSELSETVAPEPPPPPPGAGAVVEPAHVDYVTALGILPPLPPGATLTVRRNGDGSTTISLHIPAERGDDRCRRNRPTTHGG